MKWFKHDSDAHQSEKLLKIIDTEGLEWYARWFILLEAIASKMDETDRCWLELPLSDWARLLKVKPQKLLTFCSDYQELLEMSAECNENILKISVPKLLEKRDNHTKHLQVTCKKLVSKSKEIRDKSKEIENTPNGVLVNAAPEFADVLLKWNLLCAEINSIPKITAITGKRRTAIKARLSDKEFDFDKLIEAIREQPFLHGQNDRNWIVKFDWAIAETNWPKIIERNYANSRPSAPRKQNNTRQLDPEFAKQIADREKRIINL